MNVNNKVFNAAFYQKIDCQNDNIILKKRGSDEVVDASDFEEDEPVILVSKHLTIDANCTFRTLQEMMRVWFRIMELNGKYVIAMFYDNEFYSAHGAEL